ncbi:MAG TPA: DUF6599 family protein [Thermoanaerobaculia bacterium]|nr:DUF6599 family protein [Thermoanaerobaculia bacterium]
MALFVFLSTTVACSNQPQTAPTVTQPTSFKGEQFPTIDSPSLQFLPRQEEVAGWRLETDPLVLPGEQLPRYLEQDARHFQRYGVVDLTAGTYQRTGAPGFATVQIFRFPDFIKAFGAYSTRRMGVTSFLPIANEAFAGKHSIHIWRGPFYVRVMGGGSEQAVNSLKDLAVVVADRMPQATSKPAILNFFPEKDRVPNSETFTATGALGQSYFANSFTASFNVEGEAVEGLIRPVANKEAADALLQQYKKFYTANGKQLDPVDNLGEDNFTGEDAYAGRAVAFRLDRFVIVFNGFNQRQKILDLAIATDQKILGGIRKQLVAADKREEAAAKPKPATSTAPPWIVTTPQ